MKRKADDLDQDLLNHLLFIQIKKILDKEILVNGLISPNIKWEAIKKIILLKPNWAKISNKDGLTILYLFSNLRPPLEIIQILVDQGADINICSLEDKNKSILMRLAEFPENELSLKLLVDKGANLNLKDSFGNTILHYVVQYQTPETLAYFLVKNADPLVNNDKYLTPFYLAALLSKEDHIRTFVKCGININTTTSCCNFTLLHYAAYSGQLELVKLLAEEMEADILLTTSEDETAIEIAMRKGHFKVAKFLTFEHFDRIIEKKIVDYILEDSSDISDNNEKIKSLIIDQFELVIKKNNIISEDNNVNHAPLKPNIHNVNIAKSNQR